MIKGLEVPGLVDRGSSSDVLDSWFNPLRDFTNTASLPTSGFIFGRFSAIKTKSIWQNLEFLGEKLEFFEEFA